MLINRNRLIDRFDFIILSICYGIIFWAFFASVYGVTFEAIDIFSTHTIVIIAAACTSYFIPHHIYRKLFIKTNWKPFGRFTLLISFLFSYGVAVSLTFLVGVFKISFIKL
jgi:hypothetical protein